MRSIEVYTLAFLITQVNDLIKETVLPSRFFRLIICDIDGEEAGSCYTRYLIRHLKIERPVAGFKKFDLHHIITDIQNGTERKAHAFE
jgi:hypothetical protein